MYDFPIYRICPFKRPYSYKRHSLLFQVKSEISLTKSNALIVSISPVCRIDKGLQKGLQVISNPPAPCECL